MPQVEKRGLNQFLLLEEAKVWTTALEIHLGCCMWAHFIFSGHQESSLLDEQRSSDSTAKGEASPSVGCLTLFPRGPLPGSCRNMVQS